MTYIPVELYRLVVSRAGGCCEYCHLHQEDSSFTFHIEHVIAEKHGGKTTEENLCLSCPECNSFKGSDIASLDDFGESSSVSLLYNPRTQRWSDHFRHNGAIIEPLTSEGRVTVKILQMNRIEAIAEREIFIKLGTYPCTLPPP